ncbi:Cys-tRNA(Pro) deacylase [Thalassotalea sp. M1531]|uniref:Cys-tRNA(Pro)/Cys-tRNA(Cys) deacylase n=1 Tax=Thalassotalea algicola TaxID=2716224 RepID=A0A7Y0LBV0_9GAMM|nr:Cys-tRNA(Pro) deacylase [Thalassotalea algicola]NMP31678.1 Cys-tRNA(Pro) deacylase [Thalassotalea algicola]
MTPAVTFAQKLNIPFTLHEYQHDANAGSFGMEAVEKLNLNHTQVFKTLVAKLDTNQLAVAIVPVAMKLNFKQLAKAAKVKKAQMAEPNEVMRSTGYVLGGVSPLGQKKRLITIIDESAASLEKMYVSAGRRGLEIELKPKDLLTATNGLFATLT